MPQTLFFARHGETLWNREKRLQGSKDISLSEVGMEQAESLAENLSNFDIHKIIASKLKRAYQTAEIVGKKLEITVEKLPEFNEQSYGVFEGQLWSEIKKKLTKQKENIDDYAEPPREFVSRVMTTLDDVLKKYENQNILIVCHGGVLRILLRHLRKEPPIEKHIGYELPNGKAFIFENIEDGWEEKELTEIFNK